jgi:hypothetical protein
MGDEVDYDELRRHNRKAIQNYIEHVREVRYPSTAGSMVDTLTFTGKPESSAPHSAKGELALDDEQVRDAARLLNPLIEDWLRRYRSDWYYLVERAPLEATSWRGGRVYSREDKERLLEGVAKLPEFLPLNRAVRDAEERLEKLGEEIWREKDEHARAAKKAARKAASDMLGKLRAALDEAQGARLRAATSEQTQRDREARDEYRLVLDKLAERFEKDYPGRRIDVPVSARAESVRSKNQAAALDREAEKRAGHEKSRMRRARRIKEIQEREGCSEDAAIGLWQDETDMSYWTGKRALRCAEGKSTEQSGDGWWRDFGDDEGAT